MATGTITTLDNSGGKKRVISNLISMIDWTEAPLLKLFGTNSASKFQLENWPNPGASGKYEWVEDQMAPRTGTLDAAIADDGATKTFTVQTGEGDYIKTGDVIKIDSELFWVVSVSGVTVTTLRPWGTSTGATHLDDAAWEIVGNSMIEGAVSTTGYFTDTTQPYNYLQIFEEAVKQSGSEEVGNDYGIPDGMARQIAKLIGGADGVGQKGKAGKLAILLNKTAYHGTRLVRTKTTAGGTGGLSTFITTNVTDLSSASLTRDHIEDLVEDIWEYGGSPDTLICNAFVRRKINSFFEGAIRTERSEMTGGANIDTILTAQGISLDVVVDRWCPTNELYVMEKDKIGWIEYRPFSIYDRASTGDYMLKDVLGEYGFVVCNDKAHGHLTSISTSA